MQSIILSHSFSKLLEQWHQLDAPHYMVTLYPAVEDLAVP